MILPSHLPIPVATARDIRFEGELTARDIAYAVTVGHLAAMAAADSSGWYRIPDNRLRSELGMYNRETIARERERFERMHAGSIQIDNMGPAEMPHVAPRTLGTGDVVPNLNNRGDLVAWVVSDLTRELFTPDDGDNVMLPMDLVRGARNRHTLTVVMRLLAMHASEDYQVVRRSRDYVLVRIRPDLLSTVLGIPAADRPSRQIADYLKTVASDLAAHSNMALEVEPVFVRTKSTPRGRMRHVELFLAWPASSAFEQRLREKEAGERHWRQRPTAAPKPKAARAAKAAQARPVPAAGVTNVSVLRPKFGQFRPSPRSPIAPDDGGDDVTF